jgi:hypothetical protein
MKKVQTHGNPDSEYNPLSSELFRKAQCFQVSNWKFEIEEILNNFVCFVLVIRQNYKSQK